MNERKGHGRVNFVRMCSPLTQCATNPHLKLPIYTAETDLAFVMASLLQQAKPTPARPGAGFPGVLDLMALIKPGREIKVGEYVVKQVVKKVVKAAYEAGETYLVTCSRCNSVCAQSGSFVDTDWCESIQMSLKKVPAPQDCQCLTFYGYKAGAGAQQDIMITPKDLGVSA